MAQSSSRRMTQCNMYIIYILCVYTHECTVCNFDLMHAFTVISGGNKLYTHPSTSSSNPSIFVAAPDNNLLEKHA